MLVLLEGNIAAGKTTLGKALACGDRFVFVPEPVERWQGGFAANLLERFYADTPRWAFTLQICAYVTRTQAAQAALVPGQDVVCERSIYCDRHVFAKSLHQQGLLDDMEWALYCHFWDHFKESAPRPDAIIYLRTPAEECHRRLLARGRREEKSVSLDYLRQLEACHDEWLLDRAVAECAVLVLDGTHTWTAEDVRRELVALK
ncbi:MAG: deoxynucleoside kinase [Anaerolineae bacterium]|nr:deoxynucleoside kinase [Anaerolineae bacterium]